MWNFGDGRVYGSATKAPETMAAKKLINVMKAAPAIAQSQATFNHLKSTVLNTCFCLPAYLHRLADSVFLNFGVVERRLGKLRLRWLRQL